MYYEFLQTHKRTITKATGILLAIIFAWTALILITRIGKLPVTMAVVPSDASVTIDGQALGSGTQWLKPGTYTATMKKDGFEAQKRLAVVSDEKSQNVIAASLVPKSDEAKRWASEHDKQYKDNEKYGALQAKAENEYFVSQNPIVKKLPYVDPYYTIGYVTGSNDSLTITIQSSSPRYRFYAVEKIRDMGYDPTDFVIQFKDFKNPLEAK